MSIGVYQIRNRMTGHIYVGSSSRVERRFYAHHYFLTRGTHKNDLLQSAWQEWGEESFDWSVITIFQDIFSARAAEQRLLDLINCWSLPTYNLCFDSKGALLTDRSRRKISDALRGRKFTEEHKRRISNALIGRYYSPETRAKIGAFSRQRVHSDQTKAKIGSALLGRTRPTKNSDMTVRTFLNTKTGEKVTCATYEMRIRYGLRPDTFSRLIKGKLKKTGGWTVLEEKLCQL
jgi:group I intron endonuclease